MCLCVFHSKDLCNSAKQLMVEKMVRKYDQMHRNYKDRQRGDSSVARFSEIKICNISICIDKLKLEYQ